MLKLDLKSQTGIQRIRSFLNGKGYIVSDQVVDNFNKIDLWRSWYKGYDPSFHSYQFYNGSKMIHRKKKTMQMAKRISEDWANMLANEKTQINCSNQEALDDWINDNEFLSYLNTMVEKGMSGGNSALVLTLQNVKVEDDKPNFTDSMTKITIYESTQIYPISYDEKNIYECAFVSSSYENNKNIINLVVHHVVNGKYVITTYKVEDNQSMTELGYYDYVTNDVVPWFAIFKPNINENQVEQPSGQSIFANAIDHLQGIDTTYDGLVNELELGRMRIFLQADLTRFDDSGERKPAIDFNDGVYYALPTAFGDDKAMIHDFAPTLRTASFIESLQEELNMLSISCGLGAGFYVLKNVGTAMTATAIYAGNQDLYRSTKKHEMNIEKVIRNFLRAVNSTQFSNITFDYKSLAIIFDDSIIENKSEEKTQDITQINAGVMSKIEYREKWFGETEDEARKAIAEISSSQLVIIE